MRNLKKFLAVLISVALLATMMMVPALAAVSNEDEAEALKAIGLFKGTGDSLALESGLTREQGLILVIRAMGKEAEALAMTDADVTAALADVTDVNTIGTWAGAKNYAAYAIKNELTLGVSATELVYGGQLDFAADQLVILLLRAMGYEDVTKENCWDLAVTAKFVSAGEAVALDMNNAITRDVAAGILYNAVKDGVCKDGKILIDVLIAAGAVDKDDAAKAGFIEAKSDTFGVESVKAINLKQIVVELTNENYDKDELTDEGNYEFKGEDATDSSKRATEIDIKKASVDGTTLTLTLVNEVENQSEGTLVIDKAITGKELTFKEIEFFDNDIPTIESVEVIGKDLVKFVFSEPIADLELAATEKEFSFKIGSKSYGVDTITEVDNGLEANVKVYGTFTEGTLTAKVGNGLEDYAGFNIIAKTYEVDVVEDTEAPEVIGYKDANKEEVTLIFNEDIQLESKDVKDFYHTNSRNEVASISAANIDGNELTLDFSTNTLPDGTAYIYIKADAVSDFWDNENNSIKVKIEIEEDVIDPEVEKVKYENGDIKVTFSEEMDTKTAQDVDNYTLVDEDGDSVSIRTAKINSDRDKVTLDLREATLKDGIYELTVEEVEDIAGNEVKKVTLDVEVGDTTAPAVVGNTAYWELVKAAEGKNPPEYKIYIDFNDTMEVDGSYSVDDLDKYELSDSGTRVNLGKAADDDDFDVDLDVTNSGKTIEITIDYAIDFVADKLYIGRVADTDGNLSALEIGPITFAKLSDAVNQIKIADGTNNTDAPVATAKKVIAVEFTGNIDDYEIDDFIVWADKDVDGFFTTGEKTYPIDDIEIVDSNEAKILLDKSLPTGVEAQHIMIGTISGTDAKNPIGTENSYGRTLAPNQALPVADEVVPEVYKQDNVDTSKVYGSTGNDDGVYAVYAGYDDTTKVTTVSVIFTEELKYISAGTFVVNDGEFGDVTILTETLDANGRYTVVFSVKGELLKGDDIDVSIINDMHGNYAKGLALQIEYVVE